MGLFWEKLNFGEYIPMVPTSAITGDGMGDLMAMMVLVSQKFMANQLMWSSEVEATIMEVPTHMIPPPPLSRIIHPIYTSNMIPNDSVYS